MIPNKSLSVAITLLLVLPSLLTPRESHAMLRSATKIKPTKIFSARMRHLNTTATPQQDLTPLRHFLAGAAAAGGALYATPHIIDRGLQGHALALTATAGTMYGTKRLLDKCVLTFRKRNFEKNKMALAALYFENPDTLKQFIQQAVEHNISPYDFVTKENKNALMAACQFGDLDSVKTLMEHGGAAFINAICYEPSKELMSTKCAHQNAISYAVASRNTELIHFLCTYPGVSINFHVADTLIAPPDGFTRYPRHVSGPSSLYAYLAHRAKHIQQQDTLIQAEREQGLAIERTQEQQKIDREIKQKEEEIKRLEQKLGIFGKTSTNLHVQHITLAAQQHDPQQKTQQQKQLEQLQWQQQPKKWHRFLKKTGAVGAATGIAYSLHRIQRQEKQDENEDDEYFSRMMLVDNYTEKTKK